MQFITERRAKVLIPITWMKRDNTVTSFIKCVKHGNTITESYRTN